MHPKVRRLIGGISRLQGSLIASWRSASDGSGNSSSDCAANTQDCTNVPIGSYTVTETGPPANFVLDSLTCKDASPVGELARA